MRNKFIFSQENAYLNFIYPSYLKLQKDYFPSRPPTAGEKEINPTPRGILSICPYNELVNKLSNFIDKDTLKCIHDLNLSTLLLSQRMLEKDKAVAMYRLGINEETADVLSNLNASQMLILSETNQLIFQLRFENSDMVKRLTEESRVGDIKQMHTGILLSSLLLDSMNK